MTLRETERAAHSNSPDAPSRWRQIPVLWAIAGALALLFQAWVYVRWAIAGNAHPIPPTGVDVPPGRTLITRITQVGLIGGFAGMLAVCWWRSRKLGYPTLSTALLIGYVFAVWSDPISGAVHYAAGQNRLDLNVASWGPALPGWHGPAGQVQTVTEGLAYPYAMVWVWVAMAVVTLARHHRPQWSKLRVALTALVITFAVDIPLELIYIRLGGFSYPRVLPHFTLFPDQWYRLPLTSSAGMVLLCAMPVALMLLYAKPGHEVWLLHGTQQLPHPVIPWIRILAGIGFVNIVILLFNAMMLGASLVSYPAYLPGWMNLPKP